MSKFLAISVVLTNAVLGDIFDNNVYDYGHTSIRRQDNLDIIRVIDESISNVYANLPSQVKITF